MARRASSPVGGREAAQPRRRLLPRVLRWGLRAMGALAVLAFATIVLFAVVPPPTDPYILAESRRLGAVRRTWVPADAIAPVMLRSIVAAEDANFCLHWGFDMAAIRTAIDEGGGRGASTLSQQTVKNLFLWQGRSWARKALEALLTPAVEAVWPKRRILEVYLNLAEFGTGTFGIEAAAQEAFKVSARDLTPTQAARLAAVLPDPKRRSAAKPTASLRRRAAAIADGAATIRADGRAACFEARPRRGPPA